MKSILCRIFSFLLFLILLLHTSAGSATDDGFVILEQHFDGVLHENNVMSVTETQTVLFKEERHGINRTLRTEYTLGTEAARIIGAQEMSYHANVKNISVSGAPFKVTNTSDAVRIRIGDANKTVIGQQTYTYSYDYEMPDDLLESCDFLFYSVMGLENTTSVENFTFEIRFEKPIPKEALSTLRLYSGNSRSTGNQANVLYQSSPNVISGSVQNLKPGNAITVFMILPNKYFVGAYKVSPVPSYLSAVIALVICIISALQILFSRQKRPAVSIEYHAPDGISSADAGMILYGKADDIDIISLIPTWASKGYLTIERAFVNGSSHLGSAPGDLILHKENPLPDDAPEYEKTFFNALFEPGPDRNLSEGVGISFSWKLDKAKKELNRKYSGDHALRVGYREAAFVTFLPMLTSAVLFSFSSVVKLTENIATSIILFSPMLVTGLLMYYLYASEKKGGTRIALIALSLLNLLGSAELLSLITDEVFILPVTIYIITFALSGFCALFGCRLIRDSDFKLQYAEQLEGFKAFIESSDTSQLISLAENNPGYFYEILPFAMVFGLADAWADHFSNLSVSLPIWYTPSDEYPWDSYTLTRSLIYDVERVFEDMRKVIAAQSSSSSSYDSDSSSSDSDSGFSGGGGGGGGTSSW